MKRTRIMMYSHDTVGLGHIRRNHGIASILASTMDDPSILIVSGSRHSTRFDVPPNVEHVTIPSLMKSPTGEYAARSRGLTTAVASSIRREVVLSAARNFQPDVFIVDKVPRGVDGELDSTLEWLRERGETRCVLGFRDILDEPRAVHQQWARERYDDAIREFYDAIWVYGDPRVFDLANEYCLPDHVRQKVTYVGYLDRTHLDSASCQTEADQRRVLADGDDEFALCMVGGGEDGARLAVAFAEARRAVKTPGVILTGPFMPVEQRDELRRLSAGDSGLYVIDFMDGPEKLMSRANRIVAMGGYNTVCEILSKNKRALIVPRVIPRTEQLIRAERMSDLGLVSMLHPGDLTPDAIANWLRTDIRRGVTAHDVIDLDGMKRLPRLVCGLRTASSPHLRIDGLQVAEQGHVVTTEGSST